MINESQARHELEKLATKYLKGDPDLPKLIDVINDKTRPGLPVRGVLERIRHHKVGEYVDSEKQLIEELIYLYG